MDGNRYKRQFYNPEKVVARFRSLTTPEPTTVAKNAGAFATSAKSASTEKKEPIVTSAPPAPVAVVKDTKPPVIHITSPEIVRGVSAKKAGSRLTVIGQATDESGVSDVTVRDVAASLDEQGNFSAEILLKPGENQITVTALDIHGNRAEESFIVRRDAGAVATAPPAKQEAPPSPPVNRYFALVIGNNEYRSLEKLETAVADARAVAQALKDKFGFETKLLLNARREEIVLALSQYRRSLDAQANLLIYYAGHGFLDREVGKAYWLPVAAIPGQN